MTWPPNPPLVDTTGGKGEVSDHPPRVTTTMQHDPVPDVLDPFDKIRESLKDEQEEGTPMATPTKPKTAPTEAPTEKRGPDFTLARIGEVLPPEPTPARGPSNRDLLIANLGAVKQEPGIYFQVAAYAGKKTATKAMESVVEMVSEGVIDGEFDVEVRSYMDGEKKRYALCAAFLADADAAD